MSRQELASGVWSDIMDMSKPGGLVLWIRADRVLCVVVWLGITDEEVTQCSNRGPCAACDVCGKAIDQM